jgi:hypothetical protein
MAGRSIARKTLGKTVTCRSGPQMFDWSPAEHCRTFVAAGSLSLSWLDLGEFAAMGKKASKNKNVMVRAGP